VLARELSWRGKFVGEFEAAFAKHVGVKHALTCCNGTAALHLALLAGGIGPGDEVILPVLSYVATANAVRYCQATPIFVDVEPDTWCMDLREVEKALTPRTRAILPVQLYGHWPDMDALMHLAVRRHLIVVEDSAEALNAHWRGRHAGTFGVAGVFSFFANKTITCGEGGMVVTHDDDRADLMRRLRGQGAEQHVHQYYHSMLGFNYRMTNLQAAVGLAQLETINHVTSRRAAVVDYYHQHLAAYETQRTPMQATVSDWMYTLLVPKSADATRVRVRMADAGVETRPVFLPMTQLPMYESKKKFPVAEDLSLRGINLPTHAGLTSTDLAHVVDVFQEALSEEAGHVK